MFPHVRPAQEPSAPSTVWPRASQHDWTVIDLPGVSDRVEMVVRSVRRGHTLPAHLTIADLRQDALIHLARNAERVRGYVEADELGHLVVWLRHRLANDLEKRRTKARAPEGGLVPLDELQDDSVPMAPRLSAPGYSTELVGCLLVAVVDQSCAYGMSTLRAPVKSMPRAQTDPALGCTLFAHLADIRQAWRSALLTVDERRAVLLRCAFGWRSVEVAELLGTSVRTVDRRVQRGLRRMADHLNGVSQISVDDAEFLAA